MSRSICVLRCNKIMNKCMAPEVFGGGGKVGLRWS